MRRHEAGRRAALPRAGGLGGDRQHESPFARGPALAGEGDAPLPLLPSQMGLERGRGTEDLGALADDHLALPARPPSRAQVLEADSAPPRGVQEVLAHPDAGATSLGLEDDDGLRQARREARCAT